MSEEFITTMMYMTVNVYQCIHMHNLLLTDMSAVGKLSHPVSHLS